MDEDKTVGQMSNLTFDNALNIHVNSRFKTSSTVANTYIFYKYGMLGATKILTSARLRSQYL